MGSEDIDPTSIFSADTASLERRPPYNGGKQTIGKIGNSIFVSSKYASTTGAGINER